MEAELLTRNYQKPPSVKEKVIVYLKTMVQKNSNVWTKFKNPKILTLTVLALILVVVFLAILVITRLRNNNQAFTPPENVLVTQTATPSPTPKLSEIGIQIQQFNQQLNDQGIYSVKLKQPIVDLDLSLDK